MDDVETPAIAKTLNALTKSKNANEKTASIKILCSVALAKVKVFKLKDLAVTFLKYAG